MAIGYYTRRSSEKGDDISIENQVRVIDSYVKSQKDLNSDSIIHFSDDGYTGITLNRPDFKKLLTAIRGRQIDVILVKDFSRFARNYLDVCKLIESILPFMKIRFISVSDNYDSDKIDLSIPEIAITFKAIMNEYHVIETSKKIYKVYGQKLNNGGFFGLYPPYGYIFSNAENSNKKFPVIDEEKADVVRRIFTLKLNGYAIAKIAGILNSEGILSPSGKLWTYSTISKILKNTAYMGTKTSRKFVCNIKTKRKRKTLPEERIIIENAFPPIIDTDTFNKVLATFSGKTHPYYQSKHILAGKIYCGHCNKTLLRTGTSVRCKRNKTDGLPPCFSGVVSIELIYKEVLHKVKEFIKAEITKYGRRTSFNKAKLEKEVSLLKEKKIAVFEKYANKEISESEYAKLKQQITDDILRCEKKLEISNEEIAYFIGQPNGESVAKALKRLFAENQLTKEHMIFVKAIKVYGVDNFEIILENGSPTEITLNNMKIYEEV